MSWEKRFFRSYLSDQITNAPFIHSGEPAPFGINKNHRAKLALVQTTGFGDQYVLFESK